MNWASSAGLRVNPLLLQGAAIAQDASMPEFIPVVQSEPLPGEGAVHLELRQGEVAVAVFTLDGDNILIGTAPGCDVRLTQPELPPLLCLLTHEPGGLRLRQLSLTTTIEVDGEPGGDRLLLPGMRLSFSGFSAHFTFTPRTPAPESATAPDALPDLAAEAERLAAERRQLEDERRDWEQDAEKQAEELAARSRKVLEDAEALARERAQFEKQQLEVKAAPTIAPEPVQQLRQQLETYRDELYDRYQKRRDHLHALQDSVGRAAAKVQEEKRALAAQIEQMHLEASQHEDREAALKGRAAELEQARAALFEQHRLVEDWQREMEREYATRLAEVEAVEKRQARERERLASGHLQYQGDLARLDRMQIELEERDRMYTERARQLDEQTAQLKQLASNLQSQARDLEDLDQRHKSQTESQNARELELAQRAAQLETQQTTLAGLRGRIERLQADLAQREGQLTEQRLRQDRLEAMLQEFQRRLKEQTSTLHQQQEAWNTERRQMEERCAGLEAEADGVRRRGLEVEELRARLESRRVLVESAGNEQAEAAELLRMRAERLQKIRKQLHEERDALHEREQQLTQEMQATESQRAELRKQSDVLAEREKHVAETQRQVQEAAHTWQERRAQLDVLATTSEQEILGRKAELTRWQAELAERDLTIQKQLEQYRADAAQLEVERQAARLERQEADTRCRDAVTERERLQIEITGLQQRLPDLLQQAQASIERAAKARGQLREHLCEIHEYSQQSQGAFQASHRDLFNQSEQLRQQQSQLLKAQDEHRHTVSAFKQLISEWQGQIGELKQAAHRTPPPQAMGKLGESVPSQPDIPVPYRKKLREQAEQRLLHTGDGAGLVPSFEVVTPLPPVRTILPIRTAMDPEDERLVEQLRHAGLLDQPTIDTLIQAGRQRGCGLRKTLLEGEYLTPFQLECLDAGRAGSLCVGAIHLVDRLRQTAVETVYRVFDERSGEEALLRELNPAASAERKAEFRKRFTSAATVQHLNLAVSCEVIERAGTCAVLQELVVGVPSGEWREAAAVPGVWRRLMLQAAAGLQAAHAAGLVHGHLHAGRLLLNEHGELKICGLGEPVWLDATALATPSESTGPLGDLQALGRIAKSWLTNGIRKPARPTHEALHVILDRLLSDDPGKQYASAQALIDHLNRIEIRDDVPAWEAFVAGIRVQLGGEVVEQRKSA
jgi:hypothetical protein